MKTLPLLLCLAVFTGRTAAQERIKLADLILEDGTKLKDTVVLKVEPDGLRLEHKDGVSKVRFENLPEAVQKRFTFDLEQAKKFREEKETERANRAVKEHKARVEEMVRQQREVQEHDFATGREEFYRLLESGEYSYPQLDKALQENIAVLTEAGREDLAAQLEDDRRLLRERELIRPGEKARQDREQLLARIRDLENQVAQLNNAPQPVAVIQETGVIPIFVDRPIVVNPYYPGPACGVPRPVATPGPCPPAGHPVTGPPRNVQPVAPFIPASPAIPARPVNPAIPYAPSVPRSSLPVAPSQPMMPTRVTMPSSGAQQFGAHLWKK